MVALRRKKNDQPATKDEEAVIGTTEAPPSTSQGEETKEATNVETMAEVK